MAEIRQATIESVDVASRNGFGTNTFVFNNTTVSNEGTSASLLFRQD